MYQPLNIERKENIKRSSTICSSPEDALREYVLNNEINNIVKLIKADSKLLEHIYIPENKTVLLLACSEERVETKTVKTLIDFGADVHFSSQIGGWEALHFAAYKANSSKLKVIIDNFKKNEEINSIATGCNALHILLKHGKKKNQEFIKCAELLVKKGIDVNLGDNNYISSTLWAAKKGYADIIKIILDNSIVPVDLDTHQSRKTTARDLIITKQLYDGPLPEKIHINNEKDEDILFKYIQMNNEDAFVYYKNGDILKYVNANDTSTTLLQLCCEKGLSKAASHLLSKDANPNLTTEKNLKRPIEIVTRSGDFKIFQVLLDNPKTELPNDILITLLKYYEDGIDHVKCYEYMLKKLQNNKILLNINEQDISENSSLHYAVRYAGCERVSELLGLGASLGSKNKNGFMPIQDIEPEVLEQHLDECVRCDIKSKKSEREQFSVTFNYRTLIPPVQTTETAFDCDDPETSFDPTVTQELVEETRVIYYMSNDPELKHLLQHPVIASFLFIKWHRIRLLFYTNLAFYFVLFLSLVIYIFASYANFKGDRTPPEQEFVTFIKTILMISYFLLMFRELFQIAVAPRNYFKNFENYIEITLIVITGCIIFINSPSDHLRKKLSSISILLAAFELLLMLGQHPKLSTNVEMLKTVSLNFFKLMMWYSLLIVAFALSFYILFSDSEQVSKEEVNLISDISETFFKTILRTAGDLDPASVDFNTYPIISKIIFVLFIFMIVIILLNLLNGLAVSDTQMIESNAELVGHIARAKHIHYVESMMLGNILPTNFIKKLNEIFCCFPRNPTQKYTMLRFLAKKVCIFPHYLNYELTMYPYKCGEILFPVIKSKKICMDSCSNLYLDKTTVSRTNSIVQTRRESHKTVSETQQFEGILRNLEESIKSDKLEILMLQKKIDDILRYMIDNNNDDYKVIT